MSIPMQIQQLLQDKQFSLALMLAVSNLIFPEVYTVLIALRASLHEPRLAKSGKNLLFTQTWVVSLHLASGLPQD